jgi:hypothetical protein
VLYVFGFERTGAAVGDLYFVDPNPRPGQEGAERAASSEAAAWTLFYDHPYRAGDGPRPVRASSRLASGSRLGSSSSAICGPYPLTQLGSTFSRRPAWVFRAEGPARDEC